MISYSTKCCAFGSQPLGAESGFLRSIFHGTPVHVPPTQITVAQFFSSLVFESEQNFTQLVKSQMPKKIKMSIEKPSFSVKLAFQASLNAPCDFSGIKISSLTLNLVR
jgi:hypothetical protein